MSKNKKIKFIDFIKRDFEEEFNSFGYSSYVLLWYKPDIILLHVPKDEIVDKDGNFICEYNFFVDALKKDNYTIENTIVNIECNDKIKPYYFFFATNAMLPMYNSFIDEQFFDCIKKHEDKTNFRLDEVLKTLKEKIKSEAENFDPLSYRSLYLDEQIRFLERLKESE